MTPKPNPKDYPFNYVLSMLWDDPLPNEPTEFANYRDALAAIQKRWALGCHDEWSSGLAWVFPSRNNMTRFSDFDDDSLAVAHLRRERDAYQAALDEWRYENYREDEYNPANDAPPSPEDELEDDEYDPECDEEWQESEPPE
ncbi:MAG TPA: hypothetical protein VFE24_03780 [Pirellulales bacterium]|jgi:hypothetical protein|nr:hypothetical protein [Pirellulales bacterium]